MVLDKLKKRKDPGIDEEVKKKFRSNSMEIKREALETSNHRNNRILFYEYGCQFCRQWIEIIGRFNSKLDRRAEPVRMIDVNQPHPLVEGPNPSIDAEATPTLYIDGIMVKGITTKGFGRGFLEGFLEEEMLFD